MSADRWGVCPQCKLDAEKEAADRRATAEQSYGKVSAAKYAQLLAAADKPVELEDEFREDYEIYTTEDFRFVVSYRGGCEKCNFEVTYRAEHDARKMPKTG